MASAAAKPLDLRLGKTPPVCVKTGVPTEYVTRQTTTVVPPWTWLLYPLGIVPGIVAQLMTARKIPMTVHITPAAYARALFLSRLRVAGLAVVAGLLLIAALTGGAVATALALVTLVALVGTLFTLRSQLWISVRVVDDWIWLRHVHPDFAEALGRQYADLPAEARPI